MESDVVGGMDGLTISATLQDATAELHRHSTKCYELFDAWRPHQWPLQLRTVHAALVARFPSPDLPVLQPNPWSSEGVAPASKRYLSRLLKVFGGQHGTNPVDVVAAACAQAVGEFGAGVKLLQGPPKKEQRVMEKARVCTYDGIRDYGRLSLIVNDTHGNAAGRAAAFGVPRV